MMEPRTTAGKVLLDRGREFIAEAFPDGIRGNDGWAPDEYGAEGLTAAETVAIYVAQLREAILKIEAEAKS